MGFYVYIIQDGFGFFKIKIILDPFKLLSTEFINRSDLNLTKPYPLSSQTPTYPILFYLRYWQICPK